MAIENLFKGKAGKIALIGVGLAVIAPVVLPVIGRMIKPASRAAMRSGKVLYAKGAETAAEIGEVIEDMVGEARNELQQGVQEPDFDDVAPEVAPATASGGESGTLQ